MWGSERSKPVHEIFIYNQFRLGSRSKQGDKSWRAAWLFQLSHLDRRGVMRKFERVTLLAVCLFACSTARLNAQSTATIVGTVTDPSGAVVAGAEIKVTQTGTGQSRTYTTNSAGAYQASQLQIGNYTVEVTNTG